MIIIADETGLTKDGEIFLLKQELAKLREENEKLKSLAKESLPELESYYRSRRMSDWNNGKSEKREILINKIKEALGE